MAVIIGILFIAIGIGGLVSWFPDFLSVLRGLGPISILLGGIVALVAGIEKKDKP